MYEKRFTGSFFAKFQLNLGKPTNIEAKYFFQNNDLFGSTKTKVEKEVTKEFPDLEPLFEAETLAELELKNSISWYFGEKQTNTLQIIVRNFRF